MNLGTSRLLLRIFSIVLIVFLKMWKGKKLKVRAKTIAGTIVLTLFLVGLMMPRASANGYPDMFKVMQMGVTYNVDPIESPQSAVDFYDFYSDSGHTPFMEDLVSKIYVYRDTTTGELSLIMHHSMDDSVADYLAVNFDLEGVPAGAYTALSDDPGEFDLAKEPEGTWEHWYNSDGGIVGGLPTDAWWSITVHPDFITGIVAWQYQKTMSNWNIELNMDQPVTICHIPPMPSRHDSWTMDPKYDQVPGPSYGDIMKAGISGPVGYWTGSGWEPAIILRMQVHGRIPDIAPPSMPTTIACFSWRFDTDRDPSTGMHQVGIPFEIGIEWEILIASDGSPGDPDPGAGTWSLLKWSLDTSYLPAAGEFRIIHMSWPGWGDVDRLEVIVPLSEIGYPTSFDWIAFNTYFPEWLDVAPDDAVATW